MPRETETDAKAYRVVIVTQGYGEDETTLFGPHVTLRQSRQIKTREIKELVRLFGQSVIIDAYVERADNWNRVLDTDRE
jgi:hypothetical protein